MNMRVGHGLSRSLSVIHADREAIRADSFEKKTPHLRNEFLDFNIFTILKLVDACYVPPGHHQGMPFGYWEGIAQRDRSLICDQDTILSNVRQS
jgi:hypothetical protein